MSYIYLIPLGFLPSLIWLWFYLRKDSHPEPNRLILEMFIWGILLGPLAVLLEDIVIINTSIIFFIIAGGAIIEETLKYLAVRMRVLRDPEFNEPADAMIYMVIVALGFAAIENTLILIKLAPAEGLRIAANVLIIRFFGATLLHALSSAIAGYYFAKSIILKNKILVFAGILLASLLHGLYNYFVVIFGDALKEIIPSRLWLISILIVGLLIFMAALVSRYFKKLKNDHRIFSTGK